MTIEDYVLTYIDSGFDGKLPFNYSIQKFKKGDIITAYGKLEQKMYFLTNGIVKISIDNEEEKILNFVFASAFFCSYSSFLLEIPSDVEIKAYIDCEVVTINRKDLREAYKDSLLANRIGRIETERLYLSRVKREKQLLTQTAEERYRELIDSNPELVAMISIKDISKYLGIKPESLSRIRKKIIS